MQLWIHYTGYRVVRKHLSMTTWAVINVMHETQRDVGISASTMNTEQFRLPPLPLMFHLVDRLTNFIVTRRMAADETDAEAGADATP